MAIRRVLTTVRQAAADLAMVGRFARDVPPFLRAPISVAEARAQVQRQLARREARFLAVGERLVYPRPNSPYRRLLRSAGCEPGDLRALVHQEGVEGALRALADRGVYVTFDELKGRRAAVRGSQRFAFQERDFDNPLARPHFARFTGGSGGRPSRVQYPLAFIKESAASIAVVFEAHGLRQPQHACWWGSPLNWTLMCAGAGGPAVGWFYPVHPLPRLAVWGARFVSLVGLLGGYPIPLPERCDLETPEPLVDWLVERVRAGGPLALRTMPSAAVRIAVAATRMGRDLQGVVLVVGGEPVTAERRQQIEASGAHIMVIYSSVELTGLSYSCVTPHAPDDVHLMAHRFAVVQRQRPASAGGPVVDAMLLTGLTPWAAKVAFNAELGDYARVEDRDCGCLLGSLGLRTHLSDVRSFEKLTGEGVTFVSSDFERILERQLPARFGGSSLDYQLAEEEQPGGATRLVLRVHPSVGPVDENLIRAVVLEEIGRGDVVARYHADLWRQAGTLEIRREPPLTTAAGKVLPFHLLRPTEARHQ